MARKLNPAERDLFDEIVRESDASSVEISSKSYMGKLKERQQEGSPSLGQLALWLSEDPLNRL